MLNQSPILARELHSYSESWRRDKVDNVHEMLSETLCDAMNSEYVPLKDTRDFYAVIEKLRNKFHDEQTTYAEKVQILTLMPSHWSVQKIVCIMNTKPYIVQKAKDLASKEGILATPSAKFGKINSVLKRLNLMGKSVGRKFHADFQCINTVYT